MLSGMSFATIYHQRTLKDISILHPMTHNTKLIKERLLMFPLLFWAEYIATFIESFASQNTQVKILSSLGSVSSNLPYGVLSKYFSQWENLVELFL